LHARETRWGDLKILIQVCNGWTCAHHDVETESNGFSLLRRALKQARCCWAWWATLPLSHELPALDHISSVKRRSCLLLFRYMLPSTIASYHQVLYWTISAIYTYIWCIVRVKLFVVWFPIYPAACVKHCKSVWSLRFCLRCTSALGKHKNDGHPYLSM